MEDYESLLIVIEVEVLITENAKDQDITIFLMAIYDKSEMENIADKDLKNLIDEVNAELDSEDNTI